METNCKNETVTFTQLFCYTLLYYTHFPSFYRALLRPIHQPSLYAFPYPPPSLSLSAPPPSTIAAARRTFPSA